VSDNDKGIQFSGDGTVSIHLLPKETIRLGNIVYPIIYSLRAEFCPVKGEPAVILDGEYRLRLDDIPAGPVAQNFRGQKENLGGIYALLANKELNIADLEAAVKALSEEMQKQIATIRNLEDCRKDDRKRIHVRNDLLGERDREIDDKRKLIAVLEAANQRQVDTIEKQIGTILEQQAEIKKLKDAPAVEPVEESPPRLTWVTAGAVVYLYSGDELLYQWRNPFVPHVLRQLGFEVDCLSVDWEDMHAAATEKEYLNGSVQAPSSLASLKKYLGDKKRRERHERARRLQEELDTLRQEIVDEEESVNSEMGDPMPEVRDADRPQGSAPA
jgi:hypothetical protein